MAAFAGEDEGLDNLGELSDLSDEFETSIDKKLSTLRVNEHTLSQVTELDLTAVSYSRDLNQVNSPAAATVDDPAKQQKAKAKTKTNKDREKRRKNKEKEKGPGPKLLPGKVKILKRVAPVLSLSVEAPEFVPSFAVSSDKKT